MNGGGRQKTEKTDRGKCVGEAYVGVQTDAHT